MTVKGKGGVRTRQYKTKLEKTKKEIIAYSLQHPEASFKVLAEKFWVSAETARQAIKKEVKDPTINYDEIVENSKEIVLKGQKIILEKIGKLDLNNQSDLNLLSWTLKNSQALINMIEGNQNTSKAVIPVNITVNVDKNSNWEEQQAIVIE